MVRAPIGDLIVDTAGRDTVEVQVNNAQIQVRETCGRETIEITSNEATGIQDLIEWTITVPREIHLDLVAYAGSIQIGDSDGNVTLRTTGGSVTAGRIRGRAAIISQGGFIQSGDIGGSAELRSEGGSVEVGDIAGNAELQTGAGPIRAGSVRGRVSAETAGGSITIDESGSDVVATTLAGDISVGAAGRVDARTAGGNIWSRRVRGPFQGHTESGNIHVESAGSWVEASTGFGDILVRMSPENPEAELHADLQAGIGDVTIYLPSVMKASVEATVERPAFEAQRIFSDFPIALAPFQDGARTRLLTPTRSQFPINGGGNPIRLHTSLGKIEIRRQ